MTGFSFPPPPPPPPKATSSLQQTPPVQSNTRGGGRGGRGNRGSFRGRGDGQQRGGRPQQPQYRNHDNNANHGYEQSNLQQNYNNNVSPYQQQFQVPPGSYVNPAFGGIQGQTPVLVPQYGQPPIYQANSTYPNNTGVSNSTYPNNTGVSNSWSGQKRTQEQAFPQQAQRHPMRKPPNTVPKPQVAPAVPSFGAPIPLPPKPTSTSTVASASKPRAAGNLGLLPQTYTSDQESSASEAEDEEVDEEAALSALKSGPLTFEIDGEVSTLKSEAEIAEWIEERRKMWPSKRRIEEKQGEVRGRMEERRRIEEETRAAIAIASGGVYQPVTRARPEKPYEQHQEIPPPDASLEETKKELEIQMQKVTELQALLASKQQTKAPREEIITLLTQKAETERLLAETASKEQEQEQEQEEQNSDSAPEETSSKLQTPIRVPPPPQMQHKRPSHQLPERKQCVSFLNTGRCKFGGKCRYGHDSKAGDTKGKRRTLFERMMEQEKERENQLAVSAVKYLGSVGFFR